MDSFEIRILRQYWIEDDGKYDPKDLCSHGEVFIKIGDEILSDGGNLTASGLYLLRSLEMDYTMGQFSNWLIPCCGHGWIPDGESENRVLILGCNYGVDWNITHKNQEVIFKSEKGSIGMLSFEKYKNMVLKFTDDIEAFYGSPNDKEVGDFEQKGFEQFWNEWRMLKDKWVTK